MGGKFFVTLPLPGEVDGRADAFVNAAPVNVPVVEQIDHAKGVALQEAVDNAHEGRHSVAYLYLLTAVELEKRAAAVERVRHARIAS